MPEHPNLTKLAQATDRSLPVGQVVRPTTGWLRAVREVLGLTLADLAKRLKVTPPAVRSFEQAEAEDRITLASLRRSADAMDCELVYVLIPRTGMLASLAEPRTRAHRGSAAASGASPEASPADDGAKKVTDLTWHTLHGES
jgi:predicted DNA-binding mobile mystery protein A